MMLLEIHWGLLGISCRERAPTAEGRRTGISPPWSRGRQRHRGIAVNVFMVIYEACGMQNNLLIAALQ